MKTGKHLYQSPFFNKVASLGPATLLKKRPWHRCFPVNFAKFLRTPFSIEHLWWLLLIRHRLYIWTEVFFGWLLFELIAKLNFLVGRLAMELSHKSLENISFWCKTPSKSCFNDICCCPMIVSHVSCTGSKQRNK